MKQYIPWLAAIVAAVVGIYFATIFDHRTLHQLVAGLLALGVGFVIYHLTDMALRRPRGPR